MSSLVMRAYDHKLEPFASAIGELCIEWAHLETWIGRLFMMIAGWEYTSMGAMDMARCLSARDQLNAIKVGVVSRGYDYALCAAVTASANYIDNELRVARNRYVHDIWMVHEDLVNAFHIEMSPKVQKISDSLSVVQPTTMRRVSLEEVRELIEDVCGEKSHLAALTATTAVLPGAEVILRPPEPPPRLYLLRQREKQSQRDSALAGQKRQPKPSPE